MMAAAFWIGGDPWSLIAHSGCGHVCWGKQRSTSVKWRYHFRLILESSLEGIWRLRRHRTLHDSWFNNSDHYKIAERSMAISGLTLQRKNWQGMSSSLWLISYMRSTWPTDTAASSPHILRCARCVAANASSPVGHRMHLNQTTAVSVSRKTREAIYLLPLFQPCRTFWIA